MGFVPLPTPTGDLKKDIENLRKYMRMQDRMTVFVFVEIILVAIAMTIFLLKLL